jgi:O-antigen ligase
MEILYYILIALFSGIFLFLACRNLELATMLIIIALPSYLLRFSFFGVPLTILEIMLVLAFLVWFIQEFKERGGSIKSFFKPDKFKIDYPFKWEIILLLIISYVAVAMAGFSVTALGLWKAYFFEAILAFILFINVFKKPGSASKIIWSLLFSGVIISLAAIYQKITGDFIPTEFLEAQGRVTSFYSYPNAVGLYLGPIVLIGISFLIDNLNRRLRRLTQITQINFKTIFIFISILLMLLAIYFAKSEGALVGVMAGLIFYGLFFNKSSRLITTGILAAIILFLVCNSTAGNYFKTKAMLNDLTGQIRKQQWTETKKMFFAQPEKIFFGVGLGNYQKAIVPYHQEGIFVKNDDPQWLEKVRTSAEYRQKVWQPTEIYLYPHNIFLNFLTELGIFGMLLFIWIFVKFFMIGFKAFKKLDKLKSAEKAIVLGLMASFIVILVHGFVDVPYFKNDLAVMFWLLISMVSIFYINSKIQNSKIQRL